MVALLRSLLFVFLFSCIPNVNSKSSSQGNFIEKEFYSNGILKYESSYKNGKLDGMSKTWDEKGNLKSKVEYKNGFIHGTWETYYPSEQIKNTTNYIYGKKNGKEIWYHSNGVKQSEVNYINDIQDSNVMRWDETGQQIIN